MDDTMLRLLLEAPLRERMAREHRCPPSLEDPRLSERQADAIEGVIRETLDALGLDEKQHAHGLVVAATALRRASGEDPHDDPIVTSDGGYQKAGSQQS